MIFKLTAKGFKISERFRQHIKNHLRKITRALPHVEEDLIVFRLVLRKNVKSAFFHFEGTATFRLNKTRLYAHFKGRTINECIKRGFDCIFKELEKYKDRHFPAESEYPNHLSVRGIAYY